MALLLAGGWWGWRAWRAQNRTSQTEVGLVFERWPVCSDEDRMMVAEVDAPTLPVPDVPGGTVQLLAQPYKTLYEAEETVTVVALTKINGACGVEIQNTHPVLDFYPSTITYPSGETLILGVSQGLEEALVDPPGKRSFFVMTEERGSCIRLPLDEWFDLSVPYLLPTSRDCSLTSDQVAAIS